MSLCSGPSDEPYKSPPSLPDQKDGTPLSDKDIKVNVSNSPCNTFKNGLKPEEEENV